MLTEISANNRKNPCVFLLGGFDGLHEGHQSLLAHAKQTGMPLCIMTIIGGKKENLFTLAEREIIFQEQGIKGIFPLVFDEKLKNTGREEFLRKLQKDVNIGLFCCGKDFRFGKNALGTPVFIEEFTGVPTYVGEIVARAGEKVSATCIKNLLKKGDVQGANALLTTPFFLLGKVEEGRKVGRTLGFPTANFAYPADKIIIKEGVYAVHATVEGQKYNGIANVGTCPTFGVSARKVEAHLDGYTGDLYGKEIQISFDWYIRDVRKFDSPSQLQEQLKKDIAQVRAYTQEEKKGK